jgi:hypothetical protein
LLTGISLFPKTPKDLAQRNKTQAQHNERDPCCRCMLGLVTAIRPLGPAGGALVAFYACAESGDGGRADLAVYFVIALAVTLLAWPSLWIPR